MKNLYAEEGDFFWKTFVAASVVHIKSLMKFYHKTRLSNMQYIILISLLCHLYNANFIGTTLFAGVQMKMKILAYAFT